MSCGARKGEGTGRGYAEAAAAAAILSTTGIFMRHLTTAYGIPALVLAFWRNVFLLAALVPALLAIRPALLRFPRRLLPFLAALGFVLSLFNALWTLSVAINGAAVATVILYSSGAFTAVLGRLILRESFGAAKAAAIVLSVAGCALVAGALDQSVWRANVPGMAVGLLSGLAYACYSLMGRSAADRGLDSWTSTLYAFAFAAVFLLLANLVPGAPLPGSARVPASILWPGAPLAGWAILAILGAVPTLGGYGFYNMSLSHLPSSVANLVVSLEPVFTAVTAYVLLGERLGPAQLGGAALVLAGVGVLRAFEGRGAGAAKSRADRAAAGVADSKGGWTGA